MKHILRISLTALVVIVVTPSYCVASDASGEENSRWVPRFVGRWDNFRVKTPDIVGWRTRVNVYADYEFTHMDEHPTPPGGVVPQQDFFSQRHGNYLFDAEKGRARVHANLETYALTADGDGERFLKDTAQFGALEYYGEYRHREWLKIRLGRSLAPFGLFNEIRYLTPLYATVMLPFMYEPTGNVINYEAFYPPNANVMVHGTAFPDRETDVEWTYALYWGTGKRNNRQIVSELDFGRDPSLGFRTTAIFFETVKPGFSFYTVNINPQGEGREFMYELDIELGPYRGVTTQAELAMGFSDRAPSRNTWNIRLLYDAGTLDPSLSRLTPYVMMDRLDDNDDPLQRKKQNRYAGGLATRLTNNLMWKNEVHWHDYSDLEDGPVFVRKKGRRTWMYRMSFILGF